MTPARPQQSVPGQQPTATSPVPAPRPVGAGDPPAPALGGPGTKETPPGPVLQIESVSTRELVATVRFPDPTLTPVPYRERQAVRVGMPGCHSLKTADRPALPVQRWEIVVPTDTEAAVEVTSLDAYTVASDPPTPASGFSRRDAPIPEGDFGSAYSDPTPYPAQIAELSPTYQVRTIAATGVTLHPVRYLSAEGRLQIVRSAKLRVRFEPTGKGTPRYPAAPASRAFRDLAATRYANYSETVTTATGGAMRTDGAFTGTDTLLVIMPDAWDGQFDDFLEWKRQRGLRVLTALYPSQTGGQGVSNLTSYIQDTYDAEDVAYVILLGDEDAIPVSEGDQDGGTPSDTVYSLVAGSDSYHDLLISRVSMPTAAKVATLLDKYLAYEREPDTAANWRTRAMMVASNQDHSSADAVYGNDAENLALFREDLLGSDLFDSADQVYEGTTDGTTANISSSWNAGRSLIYYLGHGVAGSWTSVTFTTTNAAALSNGSRLPFVVSAACLNGAFDLDSMCLAEAMCWGTSATGQGGAVAVIASTTSMAWDPPVAMVDAFTGYYLGQSTFEVGSYLDVASDTVLWNAGELTFGSIQRAMDYCVSVDSGPNGNDELELIMQQTHLFGDCTLGVRTVVPTALVVSHDRYALPAGGLPVTVATAAQTAVEGASVTLMDSEGNQTVATTDENGTATVPADLFVPGTTVTLTVYERDSIPYQDGGILVGDATVTIVSNSPLATGFVGEAYSASLQAAMGEEPYAWSVSDGDLPEGISLDAGTGVLSGIPAGSGTHSFSILVTDNGGDTDEATFSWTTGEAVQIAAQTPVAGTVGEPYEVGLVAAGSFAPFTYTVVSGSLPDGLALGATGTLSGTPSRQGDYAFAVLVTDSQNRTAQADVSVTIQAGQQVTIDATSLVDGEINVVYAAQLEANGGSGGGFAWQILSGDLPDGLSLSAEGLISGTPTTSGTSAFVVQVTDDADVPNHATAQLSLMVGQPVAIASTVLPAAVVGAAYSQSISVVGSYEPFAFVATGGTEYNQATTASTFDETGTKQEDWYGDEVHHTLDLGFAFPYFGSSYTTCTVGDNGYIVFEDNAPATGANGDAWDAMPSRLDSYRMVAPFWCDLVIAAGDSETGIWLDRDGASVTVRWRGRDYDNPSYLINVAVTLHSSGEIEFHYGEIRTSNRVVIGLGDAGDNDSIVLFSQDKHGTGANTWSETADHVFTPDGVLPDGLSLSTDGVLSGTATTLGTYGILVAVTDAEGNSDVGTITLEVVEKAGADTDADGDVSNSEILAYIERYRAGEVTEDEVQSAIAIWQAAPPAARATTRSGSSGPRTRVRVTIDDRATLDRVVDQGLDVAGVLGSEVFVYVSPAERSWLEDIGLSCTDAPRGTSRATTSYAEITATIQTLADTYPAVCRLTQIGTSVNGEALLALVISDNPGTDEDEPEVRIVGGIHGDEPLSATVALRFARSLLEGYGNTDADGQRATAIVDSTEVWVLPVMNPDGYQADTRENASGKDLNRNFPDGIAGTVSTLYAEGTPDTSSQEPEAAAIMDWTAARRFVLGAALHSGAQLVCYPYGNHPSGSSIYSATPDDDLYIDLATTYVDANASMDTVINSCAWYRVIGELPDWAYRYSGSLEVTVELDTDDGAAEDTTWAANQEALLTFAEYAQRGLRGIVRDARSAAPLPACITIADNGHEAYTDDAVGDYHRPLLAGSYTVTVSSPGYLPQTFADIQVTGDAATRLDVDLVQENTAPRLVRTFPTPLYTPDASNQVGLRATLDAEDPPSAFIVREILPNGWTYVDGSAADADTGTPLDAPRLDGNTVSWLFWRTEVHDQQFSYSALAPSVRTDTATFGGALDTLSDSTATSGDATWLAETNTRFVLDLAAGWNLVSFPVEPLDGTPESVFAAIEGITVWAWDSTTLRYRVPTEIQAKEGYWLYVPAAATVVVEGNEPDTDGRGFETGWNLFGPLSDRAPLEDAFFDSNETEWTGESYQPAVYLWRGRGYWIHAALPGQTSLR